MNPEESHDEIGDLLRSNKPQVIPPAGLEARILRSLEPRERPRVRRFWPWLLLPPAMAAVMMMLLTAPLERSPVTRIDPPPVEIPEPAPASVRLRNPLESESLALQRDFRRAGNFLINCLPTVPKP